jgi:mevalonate kinase
MECKDHLMNDDREFTELKIPGRVCLFGDKIDLKGFPVIGATVNLFLTLKIRPLAEPVVKLRSENFPGGLEYPLGEKGDWNHPLKYWAAVAYRLRNKISGFEAIMKSDIPIGSGLSSSAAVSVALAKGLNTIFNLGLSTMEIAEIAYRAEHDDLGIMCGRLDQYTIAFGGVVFIDTGEVPRVEPIQIASLPIVVGDTQEERHAKTVLNSVKQRVLANDPVVTDAFDKMHEGVLKGRIALERGDFAEVGRWMTKQQAQEDRIGAATEKLNRLCRVSIEAGAYGAKQMGAGGGGCMVAVCPGKQHEVADAITKAGGKAWIFDIFHYPTGD